MLPRAKFDVSALYYLKSNYTDDAKKKAFKDKYGYDLAPPTTFQQMKDQAIFFASPPNFYGTEYAGKEEAINGRFYEMVVAEGGDYLDAKGKPAFNSDAGVRALNWFVDLYKAKAVPPGTTNYLWDDLGQGFASGTVALDLDWPGWATFFNDPKSSKAAGNVGIVVQPAGSSGKHSGWSGSHGLSVTEACDHKDAAASLVWWLTNEDSQKIEAGERIAADPHRGVGMGHPAGRGRPLQERGAGDVPGIGEIRLPGAADRRMDRDLQRRLSRASGGDPRRQDSEGGARHRSRQGDEDPAGRRQALTRRPHHDGGGARGSAAGSAGPSAAGVSQRAKQPAHPPAAEPPTPSPGR